MRNLNIQDVEFLKNLQHEMLTQKTFHQASPRFWVVAQNEKNPTSEDYSDGSILIDEDGYEYGETVEDAVNKLLEEHQELNSSDFEHCSSFIEVIDVLVEKGHTGYEEYVYRNSHVIKENTFFLTLRECKQHIELNHYHYNESVHAYAMTAWRSPQVEKLYEILQNVDFSNVKIEGESDESL